MGDDEGFLDAENQSAEVLQTFLGSTAGKRVTKASEANRIREASARTDVWFHFGIEDPPAWSLCWGTPETEEAAREDRAAKNAEDWPLHTLVRSYNRVKVGARAVVAILIQNKCYRHRFRIPEEMRLRLDQLATVVTPQAGTLAVDRMKIGTDEKLWSTPGPKDDVWLARRESQIALMAEHLRMGDPWEGAQDDEQARAQAQARAKRDEQKRDPPVVAGVLTHHYLTAETRLRRMEELEKETSPPSGEVSVSYNIPVTNICFLLSDEVPFKRPVATTDVVDDMPQDDDDDDDGDDPRAAAGGNPPAKRRARTPKVPPPADGDDESFVANKTDMRAAKPAAAAAAAAVTAPMEVTGGGKLARRSGVTVPALRTRDAEAEAARVAALGNREFTDERPEPPPQPVVVPLKRDSFASDEAFNRAVTDQRTKHKRRMAEWRNATEAYASELRDWERRKREFLEKLDRERESVQKTAEIIDRATNARRKRERSGLVGVPEDVPMDAEQRLANNPTSEQIRRAIEEGRRPLYAARLASWRAKWGGIEPSEDTVEVAYVRPIVQAFQTSERIDGLRDLRAPSEGSTMQQMIRVAFELPLMATLPGRQGEMARALRYTAPRNILMYGVPGTGKTAIIQLIARQFKRRVSVFMPARSDLESVWKGGASRQFKGFFLTAEETVRLGMGSFALVFLDEFEAKPESGEGGGGGGTGSANLIKETIEGGRTYRGVVAVAATNHPEQLESAVLERFAGNTYHVDLPTLAERLDTIRFTAQGLGLNLPVWLAVAMAQTTGLTLRGYALLDAAGMLTPLGSSAPERDDVRGVERVLAELATQSGSLELSRRAWRLPPLSHLRKALAGTVPVKMMPDGGMARAYTIDGVLLNPDEAQRKNHLWTGAPDTGGGLGFVPLDAWNADPASPMHRALATNSWAVTPEARPGQPCPDGMLSWSGDDMGRSKRMLALAVAAALDAARDDPDLTAAWAAWAAQPNSARQQKRPVVPRPPGIGEAAFLQLKAADGTNMNPRLRAFMRAFAFATGSGSDAEYMRMRRYAVEGRIQAFTREWHEDIDLLLDNRQQYFEDRMTPVAMPPDKRNGLWRNPKEISNRGGRLECVPMLKFLLEASKRAGDAQPGDPMRT